MCRPIVNKVRCKKCDDIIESTYTHDMVRCKCGQIAVDGGNEYQRLTWKGGDMDDYIDTSFSVFEEET